MALCAEDHGMGGYRAALIVGTSVVLSGCAARVVPKTMFEGRVEDYLEMRQAAISSVGGLTPGASAPELASQQDRLAETLRLMRRGFGQGIFFTSDTSRMIRGALASRLAQTDGPAVLQTLADPGSPAVEPGINMRYPEASVRTTTPPSLLLVLPTLPAELSYRFVNRDLLLLDRNTALVLDILPDALPGTRSAGTGTGKGHL